VPIGGQVVVVDSLSGATIGGTGPGEGNLIAYNHGAGVRPNGPVAILGNSIYSNGGPGIDKNQEFSVPDQITYAASGIGGAVIQGTIFDVANSTARVELFSNEIADPSGKGEGQTFLGFAAVQTGPDERGAFTFKTSVPIPVGRFISLTVTTEVRGTTAFSAELAVTRMGDIDRDGSVNFSDLLALAQHYGQPGTPAVGDLNADGRIDFADLLLLAQNYQGGAASQAKLVNRAILVRRQR
jgi:hypothetical protein